MGVPNYDRSKLAGSLDQERQALEERTIDWVTNWGHEQADQIEEEFRARLHRLERFGARCGSLHEYRSSWWGRQFFRCRLRKGHLGNHRSCGRTWGEPGPLSGTQTFSTKVRIKMLFAALRKKGIYSRMNMDTNQIDRVMEKKGMGRDTPRAYFKKDPHRWRQVPEPKDCTWWQRDHLGDTEELGRPVYISYGDDGSIDSWTGYGKVIKEEVERCGLPVEWDGHGSDCVIILPEALPEGYPIDETKLED